MGLLSFFSALLIPFVWVPLIVGDWLICKVTGKKD